MNFGMDGPQVTGWWYNPVTGDKFNALDTYFEDNNLLIKTADGRLLNYNQIQNYVRTEADPGNINPQTTSTKKDDEIPAEILAEIEGQENDLLIPDDNIYGLGGPRQSSAAELGNLYKEETISRPQIQDFDIIDRALKGKEFPVIYSKILWDKYPEREIEMLIDVMNIPEDAIIQYYINNISMNDVKVMVGEAIKTWINRELHPESGYDLQHEPIDNSSVTTASSTYVEPKYVTPTIETVATRTNTPETKPKKTKKKIDE